MILTTIAVQITCLMVLGLLLSLTALRRSPAARHALLLATLCALLLMPVAVLVFQRSKLATFRLPLLPKVAVNADKPGLAPVALNEIRPAILARELPESNHGAGSPAAVPDEDLSPLGQERVVLIPASHHPVPSPPKRATVPWGPTVVALYLMGSILIAFRFVLGSIRLAGACRRSFPDATGVVEAAVRSLQVRLGVRHFPEVLLSDEIGVPLAVGLRRNTILLPADLRQFASSEGIQEIVLHEYAHLDQGHAWSVLVSTLCRAMFWPHPLIHALNFQISRAREEVCDNYVLHLVPAPNFARTLLQVAQWRHSHDSYPAAAGLLLPRWDLEKRVAGLLDPTRMSETRLSRLKMTSLNVAAICLCATLAGVQLSHAQDATIEVKQGNKTYVLHVNKNHPVTVKVKGHGTTTKLRIDGAGVSVEGRTNIGLGLSGSEPVIAPPAAPRPGGRMTPYAAPAQPVGITPPAGSAPRAVPFGIAPPAVAAPGQQPFGVAPPAAPSSRGQSQGTTPPPRVSPFAPATLSQGSVPAQSSDLVSVQAPQASSSSSSQFAQSVSVRPGVATKVGNQQGDSYVTATAAAGMSQDSRVATITPALADRAVTLSQSADLAGNSSSTLALSQSSQESVDRAVVAAQALQANGAVADAQAGVDQARAALTRADALYNQGANTKASIDEAQAEMKKAEANLAAARAQFRIAQQNLLRTARDSRSSQEKAMLDAVRAKIAQQGALQDQDVLKLEDIVRDARNAAAKSLRDSQGAREQELRAMRSQMDAQERQVVGVMRAEILKEMHQNGQIARSRARAASRRSLVELLAQAEKRARAEGNQNVANRLRDLMNQLDKGKKSPK